MEGLPSMGPHLSARECIGLGAALAGNVLISLALNLQKLAHRRLALAHARRHAAAAADAEEELTLASRSPSPPAPVPAARPAETDPLLPIPRVAHGRQVVKARARDSRAASLHLLFRKASGTLDGGPAEQELTLPVSTITLTPPSPQPSPPPPESPPPRQESDYLRSKLWWLGFVLMNCGEGGNFLSYGFAPASLVAPLGTFALIANCAFAPLLLRERLRARDVLGSALAVLGAATVVLATDARDVRLDAPALLAALRAPLFVGYAIVCAVGVVLLAGLSARSHAGRPGSWDLAWVLVDVGVCAIFGGFTVLSTKAVSTLLTTQGPAIFKDWITYPLLAVLIGTGIGQIRYLNRALMRFDSKLVIPTQFVLFNLSAIVGSAILFGDFARASFHQIVTFLYGCAATFAGVFVIAWTPGPPPRAEDAEGEAPTVGGGLDAAHEGAAPRRGALYLPEAARSRSVSFVGLTSAQRLLLVHSPPCEYELGDAWLGSLPARRRPAGYYEGAHDGGEHAPRWRPRSVSPGAGAL